MENGNKEKITELEIKFATVQAQLVNIHEDNARLLKEVSKLNEKVSTMQLDFSKGRGIVIGFCLFVGSVFTLVNQYFSR